MVKAVKREASPGVTAKQLRASIADMLNASGKPMTFDNIYAEMESSGVSLPASKPKLVVRKVLYDAKYFESSGGLFSIVDGAEFEAVQAAPVAVAPEPGKDAVPVAAPVAPASVPEIKLTPVNDDESEDAAIAVAKPIETPRAAEITPEATKNAAVEAAKAAASIAAHEAAMTTAHASAVAEAKNVAISIATEIAKKVAKEIATEVAAQVAREAAEIAAKGVAEAVAKDAAVAAAKEAAATAAREATAGIAEEASKLAAKEAAEMCKAVAEKAARETVQEVAKDAATAAANQVAVTAARAAAVEAAKEAAKQAAKEAATIARDVATSAAKEAVTAVAKEAALAAGRQVAAEAAKSAAKLAAGEAAAAAKVAAGQAVQEALVEARAAIALAPEIEDFIASEAAEPAQEVQVDSVPTETPPQVKTGSGKVSIRERIGTILASAAEPMAFGEIFDILKSDSHSLPKGNPKEVVRRVLKNNAMFQEVSEDTYIMGA